MDSIHRNTNWNETSIIVVLSNSVAQTAVFSFPQEPFLRHLPGEMAMWTHPGVGPQGRFSDTSHAKWPKTGPAWTHGPVDGY